MNNSLVKGEFKDMKTRRNSLELQNSARAFSANNKPAKSDVGLSSVANERQYSSNNPPPHQIVPIRVSLSKGQTYTVHTQSGLENKRVIAIGSSSRSIGIGPAYGGYLDLTVITVAQGAARYRHLDYRLDEQEYHGYKAGYPIPDGGKWTTVNISCQDGTVEIFGWNFITS